MGRILLCSPIEAAQRFSSSRRRISASIEDGTVSSILSSPLHQEVDSSGRTGSKKSE